MIDTEVVIFGVSCQFWALNLLIFETDLDFDDAPPIARGPIATNKVANEILATGYKGADDKKRKARDSAGIPGDAGWRNMTIQANRQQLKEQGLP